jgi:hypothetical protein
VDIVSLARGKISQASAKVIGSFSSSGRFELLLEGVVLVLRPHSKLNDLQFEITKTIQHPGWGGNDVGFLPFRTR